MNYYDDVNDKGIKDVPEVEEIEIEAFDAEFTYERKVKYAIDIANDNAIKMEWASKIMCEVIMEQIPDLTIKEIKKILKKYENEKTI